MMNASLLFLIVAIVSLGSAFFEGEKSEITKHHGPAYTKLNHARFLYHSMVKTFLLSLKTQALQKSIQESQNVDSQKLLVKMLRNLEVQRKLLKADGLDTTMIINQEQIGSSDEIKNAIQRIHTFEKSLVQGDFVADRTETLNQIRSYIGQLSEEDASLRYWLNARLTLQQRWSKIVSQRFLD